MAQQYFFPFAFPERQERDDTRQAIIDICRALGFMSSRQKSLLSPPTMLKFIVANAPGFIAWALEEIAGPDKTLQEKMLNIADDLESLEVDETYRDTMNWMYIERAIDVLRDAEIAAQEAEWVERAQASRDEYDAEEAAQEEA